MGCRAPVSSCLLLLAVLASPASAQVDPTGPYRASAIGLETDLREWPATCGPLPSLPQGAAGAVEVRRVGSQLSFSGAVRGRSNECFWPDRDVESVSTSSEPTRFTTICRSSEGNPLRTTVRVVVEAHAEGIAFRSTATLEREVAGRRCVAGVVAVRSLDRAVPAASPSGGASAVSGPATAAPASVSATRADARPPTQSPTATCTPGPATAVRLRGPGRDLLPGERFCPTAEVLDATGCRLGTATPTLGLTVPRGRVASLTSNCFSSSPSAAESEGRYRLEARYGGLSSTADLVVTATDLSDITAVAVRDRPRRTASTAEVGSASGIEARAVPRARKLRTIGFAGAGGLLLLGTAIVLLVRRKRRMAQAGAVSGRR